MWELHTGSTAWVTPAEGHEETIHLAVALADAASFDYERQGEVTTACGLTTQMGVPGLWGRKLGLRCRTCCDKANVRRGFGWPVNGN